MGLVLWIAPLHVAPVVSYEMLRKGSIERPRSGLDRMNLTEIGEMIIVPHLRKGGKVRFRDVSLPFPWKAEVMEGEGTVLRMDAMTAGRSTLRSMIRFEFDAGNGISGAVKELLGGIDRDPLSTPYWDIKSWEVFHKETGLTFEDVRRTDESTIRELGL